ncbi:MAG: CRISPR-associated protein Csm2 [Thermococcaceae archaeon]|nr:CRISPR-associated protein Csm2 [Thermococcaceae archaeon]
MGFNYSRERTPHGQRPGGFGSRPQRNESTPVDKIKATSKDFLKWTPQERLQNAMELGCYLSQNLKTNQIRRVLETARRVHLSLKREGRGEFIDDVVKMRYLLAYAVGKETNRYKKDALKTLYDVLDPMLEVIMNNPTPENFEVFYDFLQAVVAYHKFYGGGD